ncbi:DUF3105 domain-containing protein [Microbacterium awajiense]|uniref:DUF3105 domain-containing protein n=1 Tax=Microbacterium awajiense TaxID=415214 RepID=A0ABP7AVI0_9MICO
MTPTSSNPADRGHDGKANAGLTIKQQRELKRKEKLAEYQKQLAKRRRGRLVWWVVGSTAAVVIIGLVVASVVFAPSPPKEYEAGSEGATIAGVETFSNTAQHVAGVVEYEQSPPAGGPHNAVWLNCGVYNQPVPNENAVHSMEHGAVWVTYNPDEIAGAELATLNGYLPSTYVILSPFEGLDAPIVLSNWNNQLKVDSADDPRISQFLEEYWRSQNAPEPGAACTGALDAPGKQ